MAELDGRQYVPKLVSCVITTATWPPACEGCPDWGRTVKVMTTIDTLCTEYLTPPPVMAGPTPQQQPAVPTASLPQTVASQSKADGGQTDPALALGLGFGLGVPLAALLLALVAWNLRRISHLGQAPAVVDAQGSNGPIVPNPPNLQQGVHLPAAGGAGVGRGRGSRNTV